MQRHITDRAPKTRGGARLKAYAGIDRRDARPLPPFFENVFRRARTRRAQARVTQFVAIERRG
jgi:hypothetical protein